MNLQKDSFNAVLCGNGRLIMLYNTVIFDLDGTLLNTLYDLGDSVNFALESFGFPRRSYEEVRQFVGNGVKKLIDRAVPEGTDEQTASECLKIFRQHYSLNMENKTAPYDGIIDVLKALKAKDINTAVVSNKFDTAVKRLCDKYFGKLIDVAVGESETVKRKPSPDGVNSIIADFSCDKHKAIYVGDSDIDIITAHNAGIKCVGVTWGFRDSSILIDSGADFIADNHDKLLNIILGEN